MFVRPEGIKPAADLGPDEVLEDNVFSVLRKLAEDYDPTDAHAAHAYVQEHVQRGEYLTGLLHCRPTAATEFHPASRHAARRRWPRRGRRAAARSRPAVRGRCARARTALR